MSCLAHWQLSTYNCRSLILLTRNLMAGCALVLNSACWSSGSCFSTLSNQGCTGSKQHDAFLLAARCTDAFQSRT